ncbi:hypothetical protein MY7_3688 [Bacillus sp. 5B6]|nr:hypothetical protein MY7_3688 [Bacillus sp. 5B6]
MIKKRDHPLRFDTVLQVPVFLIKKSMIKIMKKF